jgi:iron complex outermembrane receptor protein
MCKTSYVWALLALLASTGWAAELPVTRQGFLDPPQISLEELLTTEVVSTTKRPERLAEVPAAAYVITQEDIRRSGVTSIPEALRLAPGVHVARIDANKWAIGVRGFSSRLSRALLVLIDGRSVYSPLFAGVYWEVQDTLLEDVDRIEVIRGPGGTIWGANAVNGVINIITKRAQETQGGLLVGGGGSEEQGFGGIRYGGKIGDNLFYRVYGKAFNRDAAFHSTEPDFDDWRMGQAGFRTDWQGGRDDTITVQGDFYIGDAGQFVLQPVLAPPSISRAEHETDLGGGNLLGRWQRVFSATADLTLQLYYDRTYRRELTFREARQTFDLDFQHRFRIPWQQEIILGLGYRVTSDDIDTVPTLSLQPGRRTDHLFSAFVQDEIRLFADQLRLILGAKFEHNDYSGFEAQPGVRLLWTPTARHSVWAAITRAVRTPSRVDQDLAFTTLPNLALPVPAFGRVMGTATFTSEKLLTYELGYRVQPTPRLFLDVAAFYNRYTDLFSLEPGMLFVEASPPPPRLVVPFFFRNKFHGESCGVELAADWQSFDWWRVSGGYAYLQLNLSRDPDSMDVTTVGSMEGTSPHHQVFLRSFMTLPGGLEFDLVWRYVDHLPNQGISSYWNLDARLAWRPLPHLSLAVVGQNLLEPHHNEFAGENNVHTAVERGVYGKVVWRW